MIFENSNYKIYLNKYIESLPKGGRGYRQLISETLKCKASYVSQVLNGTQDFNMEQAFALNKLLNHGEQESRYFLCLVQSARAGTSELNAFYKKEAAEIKAEALRLKNKFKTESLPSKEDELKYFSNSEFSYVHILTTIPEYQTKEALLKKLRITQKRLDSILEYLLKLGYVIYEKGRYIPGPAILHLPDDAAAISTHHTNWRVQAIKGCQSPKESDLHYSSVISISRADFDVIKAILVRTLEKTRPIINNSDSEKPFSLCLDFYELD